MSFAAPARQYVWLCSVMGTLLLVQVAARADDLPPGWSGKGQAGYVMSRGNSVTDAANVIKRPIEVQRASTSEEIERAFAAFAAKHVAAVAVAQDVTSGTVNRFKTLPILGSAVLHGHVISSVLRNLAACIPVLGVALLLGYRPEAGFGGWLAALLFVVLMILAFTWLSTLAGLFLSVDAAASINFVFLFLPYISSGFVPVDTMPAWLRGFAQHQPYTPIIETLRDLLSGKAPGGTLWVALAWLAGILVVGFVGSALAFGRRVKE